MGGGKKEGTHPPLFRRRGEKDLPDPRHAGGDGPHEDRRGIRGEAARRVHPYAAQGDDLLAHDGAVLLFHPPGMEDLVPVEPLDPFRRRFQDLQDVPVQVPDRPFDLPPGDLDGVPGKADAVEPFRVPEKRFIPVFPDVLQNPPHRLFHGSARIGLPHPEPPEFLLEGPLRRIDDLHVTP